MIMKRNIIMIKRTMVREGMVVDIIEIEMMKIMVKEVVEEDLEIKTMNYWIATILITLLKKDF